MQQTKWLKKMSYTVAAFGLLTIAQTAVSSPALYDARGQSKAGQNTDAEKVTPNRKLKSNHTKSTQDYLDGMKLDFTQVKLADGSIRVTANANNPKMPIPPTQIEYYWSAPSNSVDHYPASDSEQGESSTLTFTMPPTQLEQYEFGMTGYEKANQSVYAIINTVIVPIESTQAYVNGLETNITQTKLANGAIQVVAKTTNPTVQISPKPVEFYWQGPPDSVDHHPATESERSKSSTATFTMPATQTEKYDFHIEAAEKGNAKVFAIVSTPIVPIGSTQAYLNGLKLNVTQSKLPNGAIEVVAKVSNPDIQTSPTPVEYFWEEPSGSTDYRPESEAERSESSTVTFTMPAAQTEKYDFNVIGTDKKNYNVYTYINAPITPLRSHQSFLNVFQARDARSTLKSSDTGASTQSIQDFVAGLKLDVTQDKLANGETKVVVKAINPDVPTPPTPLSYFWLGPKGATEHNPIRGERTELSTFSYMMPAAQTETYQFMISAYDKNTDKFIDFVKTKITPAESTQAFLNGLTLDTTQTKLENGATRVVVKTNNLHTPTSPTPVDYFWRGPKGSTNHHPVSGERTELSTFEFTMPAEQNEKYNFYVTGYEEGNNNVSAMHTTSIVPIGSTQAFLNGLTLHTTQTKLESGATRVVVYASNPHEATPPMPVDYFWRAPTGSTEHYPVSGKRTKLSTFEFTMPAEKIEKYNFYVTGYEEGNDKVSAMHTTSIVPVGSTQAPSKN
ncbi:hypothetical protein QN379_05605 [Glaciimonas sp. Gout2]|uniref:hypothetical protein n=1 Tax=unclassified Glaciimonas TaxID=2644401 RepID=UPI002B22F9A2|nr:MULTISPECIES: hypothetical protein [unclassified Glaciimonas]MEB0011488.1 hypothetical protein [Glaciimonas sp. Cout2]MEB0081492.1 hypothetical protein [Glaciimonas sp. Gout2]